MDVGGLSACEKADPLGGCQACAGGSRDRACRIAIRLRSVAATDPPDTPDHPEIPEASEEARHVKTARLYRPFATMDVNMVRSCLPYLTIGSM